MLIMLRFLFLSFGSLDRMYGATSLINRNGAVLCTLSINSNMSSGVVCSICERVRMMSHEMEAEIGDFEQERGGNTYAVGGETSHVDELDMVG